MIFKRKVLFLIAWIVVAGASAAAVFLLPAIYRAETLIQVESQRIPERFVTSTVNADLKDRLTTLSQQILSYGRLLEIVQKFDLYKKERKDHVQEEIVEMKREDISIQLDETWTARARGEVKPSAFRIAYQGPNPEVVALVANQLGSLFIDENLRAREVQAVGTSEFLATQLAEAKKRLEEQEGHMSQYKVLHNGELPEQEAALLASLGQIQIQLQSVNDQATRAEQTRHLAETAIASSQATMEALVSMTEQLASAPVPKGEDNLKPSERLQRQLDAALLHFTEDHPQVKALRKLIPILREQEAADDRTRAARAAAEGENQQTLAAANPKLAEASLRERERVDQLRAQVELANRQIETANAKRAELEKSSDQLRKRIDQIPLREQELAAVRRDYEISRANYQSLLDKALSANMAAEMELRQKAERFRTIDSARVPGKPVKPNRPLLYAAGIFCGFLLGFVGALAREARTGALLGEWELPRGIPVLARVPGIAPLPPADLADMPGRGRKRRWLWIALVMLVLALMAAAAAALRFGWISLPGGGIRHV
jgi:polysaccharide chain length determinant protein (PEP-CTERM system associated)